MLECIYTSTKLVDADSLVWGDGSYPLSLFYIDDIDAMIMVQDTPSGLQRIYKVFRDGTTFYCGKITTTSYAPYSINRGRMGWTGGSPAKVCMSDEVAFMPLPMDEVIPSISLPTWYYVMESYLDLFKRKFIAIGGMTGTIICVDTDTNALLWSFTPNLKYIGSYHRFNYVDLDYIMFTGVSSYSYPKSFGMLININTGAVESTVELDPSLMVVYDCNHGVFITISSDRLVRVYANDYYPYTLGPVIPEHYGLYTYIGQDIKVRLTSIGGFPCPNRLVTWQLPTGLGTLEKSVSVTDSDGYAWNYYYGPLVAGGLETITVGWG